MARKRPPTLTPEKLVIANVERFLHDRRLTRAELGKRMAALGFGPWIHEKTVRNSLAGTRALKVDELAGLAVALETTIADLMNPRLDEADITVGLLSGVYPTLGDRLGMKVVPGRPGVRADWSGDWSAKPPRPPALRGPTSPHARALIAAFRELDWEMPDQEEDLTIEDMKAMEDRFDAYFDKFVDDALAIRNRPILLDEDKVEAVEGFNATTAAAAGLVNIEETS